MTKYWTELVMQLFVFIFWQHCTLLVKQLKAKFSRVLSNFTKEKLDILKEEDIFCWNFVER